jgi:hypothetical protein
MGVAQIAASTIAVTTTKLVTELRLGSAVSN